MPNILNRLLKTSNSVTDEIPRINYHVDSDLVLIGENHLLSVIRFSGSAFESEPDDVLNNEFDALNRLFADVSKEKAGRLALWSFVKRTKLEFNEHYSYDNTFCQGFSDKYLARFNENDFFENNYYLCVVMKFEQSVQAALSESHDLLDRFEKTLAGYKPYRLGCFENENGVTKSEIFDFLYETLNGDKPTDSIPVTGGSAVEAISDRTLHFSTRLLQQIKPNEADVYSTLFDLKDYPNASRMGMFNQAMLNLPCEFILCQSFQPLSAVKALSQINTQENKLSSAGDKAHHQHAELERAKGFIQSGELSFGTYHCVLQVFGRSAKEASDNGTLAVSSFSNYAGATFRQATASAPASFFSMFPTSIMIPRKMMKSSRNLASTFSLHNYSMGKKEGNPLGDGSAIMPLETLSKTLYNFNFHYTDPDQNNIGDSVAGHTLILGATGTGKTTTQTAMIAMAMRLKPALFALDKDRGMKNFVKAIDGSYFEVNKGIATGLNPFQFPYSPPSLEELEALNDPDTLLTAEHLRDIQARELVAADLRSFLYTLIRVCGKPANGSDIDSDEEKQIKIAVDSVMALEPVMRRFSSLLGFIPDTGANCLAQRLHKWCELEDGEFAWCLDSPLNSFDPNDFKIVGFDVTDILVEGEVSTEPLLATLFYMKRMMLKNHAIMCTVVEEFWLPLKFKTTEKMILDSLKTGRKVGEFMLLVSQSPEEVVNSPICSAIIEQTATLICLPNPSANYTTPDGGGYQRMDLTVKEFKKLKELGLTSRAFLVKQGTQSSIARLDLYGFNHEIPILSSSKETIELLDNLLSVLKRKGVSESNIWFPIFSKLIDLKKVFNNPSKLREVTAELSEVNPAEMVRYLAKYSQSAQLKEVV